MAGRAQAARPRRPIPSLLLGERWGRSSKPSRGRVLAPGLPVPRGVLIMNVTLPAWQHGLPLTPGGRIDPGTCHGPMLIVASNARTRPPMRRAGRRGRPPQLLRKWPLADAGTLIASHPGAVAPGRGQASFRALLRDARQKGADLSLPVPAVAAESPDRRELSCLRPPGHCLRVNPEHRRDFRGRKQRLGFWCTC